MSKKPIISARRHLVHTGVFNIEEMDLEFANGEQRKYQCVVGSEQGAVLAIPLLDRETVLLIREYAAGTDRYELAFPKGHIEDGEDMLEAADREIQEEVGYGAHRLEHIHSFTIAPGYMSHTTHIVLASELYPQKLPGDEPEKIEVVPWKIADMEQLLRCDDFTEARSIAALYMVRDLLKTDSTR
ncbi:MAG: ADP compounds hydrolase NudE [Gammaproteobacteria bacterium]|nr:ADP compounds hydrolase NudE [Gammaproteobacteria bacterium]